ncbi:MAG TPA: alpha/beta hydrolase [Planktothrix sp.]|jgi:pimeloyl-ACP methyl ester carboxylesterase
MKTIEFNERAEAVNKTAMEYVTPTGARKVVRSPKTDAVAQPETVPFKDGSLAICSWGEGQPILMVHGWSATRTDLFHYVAPVIARGFKAVVMDLPAHGESSGDTCGLNHLGDGVLAVANHVGPLRGVIAHSIGCAASQLAIANGMKVERAVMLASPHDYEANAYLFAKHRGLNEIEAAQMIDKLKSLGVKVAIRSKDFVPAFDVKALIVHSEDDAVIPISTSEALHSYWKGSQLLRVDGLQHRGVLKDAYVISKAVRFLTE